MASEETSAPVLRVIGSDATPEEVAAIVAVLSSLGGAAPARRAPAPSWSAPRRQVGTTPHAGAGGWRASGLPR